jgi:hypothetical protein
MEENDTSVWVDWARKSPVWKKEELRSENLPDVDARSAYAVDLAAVMTTYIAFESLGVKVKTAHARNVWFDLSPVVAFGFALGELAVMTNQERVVSSINAEYLRHQLDAHVEELGALAGRPDGADETFSMEAEAVASRASRMVDAVVQQAGGSYRRKTREGLIRAGIIYVEFRGAIAAVESIWPFISSESTREIYRPLWQAED